MYVTVYCPHCRGELEVDKTEVGMYGECPTCGEGFEIQPPGRDTAGTGRSASRPVMDVDDDEIQLDTRAAQRAATQAGDRRADRDLPVAEVDGDAVKSKAEVAGLPIAQPQPQPEADDEEETDSAEDEDWNEVGFDIDGVDEEISLETGEIPLAVPISDADRDREQEVFEAGREIAGFELGPLIGSGSMGRVYLATQLSMQREVALKILPIDLVSHDEDAVDSFMNEIRLLAQLDHPNIVRAIEAGQEDDVYYLAMTYVNGETLSQRQLREPEIPEQDALRCAAKVAKALEYAWERFELLHRDVKPANIMVDKSGEVKLMDLGIAKVASRDEEATNMVLGTPYYMSPEQAMGHTDLDHRSDQYSLGATLFHLVTGQPPFEGKDAHEIMIKHVNQALPRPDKINPKVSEATCKLIRRLMAKRPERRFPDWKQVSRAMEKVAKIQKRRPKARNKRKANSFTASRRLTRSRKRSGTKSTIRARKSKTLRPRRQKAKNATKGDSLQPYLIAILVLLFVFAIVVLVVIYG